MYITFLTNLIRIWGHLPAFRNKLHIFVKKLWVISTDLICCTFLKCAITDYLLLEKTNNVLCNFETHTLLNFPCTVEIYLETTWLMSHFRQLVLRNNRTKSSGISSQHLQKTHLKKAELCSRCWNRWVLRETLFHFDHLLCNVRQWWKNWDEKCVLSNKLIKCFS